MAFDAFYMSCVLDEIRQLGECRVEKILPALTEDELSYYRRGKNAHVHAVPKGATPAEYAKATGLEALFGALYLAGRTDRINELFHIMMEG